MKQRAAGKSCGFILQDSLRIKRSKMRHLDFSESYRNKWKMQQNIPRVLNRMFKVIEYVCKIISQCFCTSGKSEYGFGKLFIIFHISIQLRKKICSLTAQSSIFTFQQINVMEVQRGETQKALNLTENVQLTPAEVFGWMRALCLCE